MDRREMCLGVYLRFFLVSFVGVFVKEEHTRAYSSCAPTPSCYYRLLNPIVRTKI